ncbi:MULTISPECIES: tyrosine-type recombinase/integrase [unclassified Pseudoalteromonas]|uniref:tyrosine-type recombinase/integrase n=1 Tax=unclassified Pseudoalteromonas TaxID=194690 RepID=UPI001F2BC1E7|nr:MULTISPECIES: site-specific integrase [unclassified Pseudoalteromonas]MCF2826883.1 tyrosine-type recombinase/integrase [Pseudoalteromonas sp. OF5H-5]MCF2830580.1 tyrosine-type recombinase/integrase [Pseudoalteromonas sp. DL2-H6]MCF2923988.1 tyrosine-type recombinase/integrase [Pseudoalteromonas sp. DL2-H1]
MNFTDKSIKALKPKKTRYVLTESGNHGEGRLQIRVNETGTKVFRVQYHLNNARKVIGLGTFPDTDLKTARQKHAQITKLLLQKIDPKEYLEKQNAANIASEAERTFLDMLDDFDVYISTRWAESTIKRTRGLVARNITPFIPKDLKPDKFNIDMAREIIFRVYNRGAKEQSRLVRSTLMSILKFAIDYDNSPEQFKKPPKYNVKTNFIRDINYDTPKNVGQRWLSELELRQVWYADDLPFHTHNYIKLAILLGGQRVNELYAAKSSEFNFQEKIFTIPVERIKIKHRGEHIVPVSREAEKIVKILMQHQGESEYLFPHRDSIYESAHVSTIRMAILRWCDKHGIERFAPRDLRRTCKTLMGKAGIPKSQRDLLQQHDKYDVSSVHYDRYDYLKEKRESIEVWTKYLGDVLC